MVATNPQHYQACLTPQGRLSLGLAAEHDAEFGQASSLPADLLDCFQQSTGSGLTQLAALPNDVSLPPSLVYWRRFAELYFKALCRHQAKDQAKWLEPHCPDDETLAELVNAAPPMPGLEYHSAQMLQILWSELDAFTQTQVRLQGQGLATYLQALRPDWNLVGRVTFHLAENKKNSGRPFAFLATYTDSQSQSGAIRHVPLGEALKNSIATGDQARLELLLEPVSRAARTCDLVKKLLEARTLFAPQAWSIGQAFEFLSLVPRMEDAGVIVRVPNWWNAAKPPRPQVQVRIGTSRQPSVLGLGSFDLKIDVALDGEALTKDELAKLMAAREGMTLLRGKWIQVDQEHLQQALNHWQAMQKKHVSGIDFLAGLRLLSGASLDAEFASDEVRGWTRIQPGAWLAETLESLRDPSGIVDVDPHQRLHATLRPYQVDGVRWLWFATRLGLGACLADDMGLGKTIQIISLLLPLKFPRPERGKTTKPTEPASAHRPSLLIVPTSLLGNWKREVQRFGPDLKLWIAHRSMASTDELKRVSENPQAELSGYDLVATTYGLARREKWLKEVDWRLMILDEAQAIKNAGAAQSKAIKSFKSQGRILLSGTPVENHLGDLWSLFDFCSPGLLGTASEFKKFVKADDAKSLSKRLAALRSLIRPYVLRRMKSDPKIAPDLPDKTEMRVECGLTKTQAALYQQVIEELDRVLQVATGIQRRGIVLAVLMQLKQICNHPALYLKQTSFDDQASGKYAELQAICQTLMEKQEKLLVFTQFQSMCGPLDQFLQSVFRRSGLVLTGKTASAKRSKMVAEFQEEDGPPYFVVSVKAGGTGLNLTQASHVVHFDRWWNPAVEDQATDRAFRIGQKRNVIVHKFVCRGTLEEKIDDLIQAKKALSREIFDTNSEMQLTEMSNTELMKFVAIDIHKATQV